MIAVIELGFDPLLHLSQLAIRWQTVGVTVALLAAFGMAALRVPDVSRPAPSDVRLNDMVLIVVSIVPGAVVGGRIVHALAYFDAYAANPLAILNPAVGSLSLLGAVLGGFLGALYAARLIKAPLARWADIAAVPLLLALGLGKLAQLLGGSGQGLPFDGPWAVAFSGTGPWVSANAAIGAHPSQVYEGLWLLIGIAVVGRWAPRRPGAPLVVALAWFFAGRVLVGFTWRDATVLGPLNIEQLLALLALAATLSLAYRSIVDTTRTRRPIPQEPPR